MLASLEALMTLGKCRELPVVGFVRGYMTVGVIVSAHGVHSGPNIDVSRLFVGRDYATTSLFVYQGKVDSGNSATTDSSSGQANKVLLDRQGCRCCQPA